jgi:hypothetical protein
VANDDVGFLDACRLARRIDAEQMIDATGELAAAAAGEADGEHAALAAFVDSAQPRWRHCRWSTRAKATSPGAREGLDLLHEYLVVPEVVGDAGPRPSCRWSRPAPAAARAPSGSDSRTRGQVLRIRGAAAVTEEKQRTAGEQRIGRRLDDPRQGVGVLRHEALLKPRRWRRKYGGWRPAPSRDIYPRRGAARQALRGQNKTARKESFRAVS